MEKIEELNKATKFDLLFAVFLILTLLLMSIGSIGLISLAQKTDNSLIAIAEVAVALVISNMVLLTANKRKSVGRYALLIIPILCLLTGYLVFNQSLMAIWRLIGLIYFIIGSIIIGSASFAIFQKPLKKIK